MQWSMPDSDDARDAVLDAGQKAITKSGWVQKLDSLCVGCRSSQITRRKQDLYYRVYCHNLSHEVASDIAECDHYETQNEQSLKDMYEIATIITIKGKAGFTHG